MGDHSFIGIKVPKFVAELLNLLVHVKCMVTVALSSHLALLYPLYLPREHQVRNVIRVNLPRPSPELVPVPVTLNLIRLEHIKKRLPVVTFGDFLDRHGECDEQVCAVCLSHLERSHEMRELSNCCHVFHRECLDKWVDQCQITCPSCRSKLLPFQGGDPWMVEKMYYVYGEDW